MFYRVILTANTPLSFRSGRNITQSDTHPYVPGTSIIGALAYAHRQLRRDDTEFEQFFLRERIRFGNCYPASFDEERMKPLVGDDMPVLPLPLTARSCKRLPGFAYRAVEERRQRAGITDALIPLALFALSCTTRSDVLTPLEKHPRTAEPLDRLSKVRFFRRGATEEQYGAPSVTKGVRTRTGIDYTTGRAYSGILYSREVIEPGSRFWGAWHVDDDLAADFTTFVKAAQDQGQVRIGNNRTRGFGRVSVDPAFNPMQPSQDDTVAQVAKLQARIEAFTAQFKQAADAVEPAIEAPAAMYVPLLLTSDAILTDELLRARLQLDPTDLAAVGITNAELVFHAAGTRHIAGWSGVWGLPRADDWAITMGSVFLFALPQADETTFKALLDLQRQGVGLRRAEGFGSLVVTHPFHIELAGGIFR